MIDDNNGGRAGIKSARKGTAVYSTSHSDGPGEVSYPTGTLIRTKAYVNLPDH